MDGKDTTIPNEVSGQGNFTLDQESVLKERVSTPRQEVRLVFILTQVVVVSFPRWLCLTSQYYLIDWSEKNQGTRNGGRGKGSLTEKDQNSLGYYIENPCQEKKKEN